MIYEGQCFGWGMLGSGMLVIAISFVLVSVGSRNSELNSSLANVERVKTSQLLQCNGSNFSCQSRFGCVIKRIPYMRK